VQAQRDSEPIRNPKQAAKSRLFWELKAEQMLNRIFDQQHRNRSTQSSKHFTDVEFVDCITLGQVRSKENTHKIEWTTRLTIKIWLALAAGSLTTLMLSTILLSNKQRYQVGQESNLRLLSLLRQKEQPTQSNGENISESGNRTTSTNPPPPPREEWIEELAKLPQSTGNRPELLKVPLIGASSSSLPISTASTTVLKPSKIGDKPLPKLVGVIQGAGTIGSAIFQWGGSSTSVNSGETIGTSNWRLKAVNGNSAIIERSGQQQRLSIDDNN
jgi:hypothetical protein